MPAKPHGLPGSDRTPPSAQSTNARAIRRAIVLAPIVLTACQPAVLDPQGVVGIADKTILIDSLAIMLAIVVPTVAATFAFAWWFRASNTKAAYLPNFDYSGRLELIVWAIPLLVIMLLGGVAWIGSHDLDPARPLPSSQKPLEVDVVSLDWKWLFIYPDQGVASINQLIAPVGVPLHLRITSASVLNVFFVPRLGSEIYAMNGMTSQLNLQADEPGRYHGLAAHFSGDGFSDMDFELHAVPPAEFSDWAANARAAGEPTLDAASYRQLLVQTQNVKPYTYRAVLPGLFAAIVNQKLPPGLGPQVTEK